MAASFRKLIAAAAVALAFTACTKDRLEVTDAPIDEGRPLILALGDPQTRALLGTDARGRYGQWETGDRMGTITVAGGSNYAGYSRITPGTPATVALYAGGSGRTFSGGETVYAYYPFNSATRTPESVQFSIPSEQTQDGSDFDFDAMPMVAAPYIVPGSSTGMFYNESGRIDLANLASVAAFDIFSSKSQFVGETVVSVRFEADSPLAGGFTKDIRNVDLSDPSTLEISGYTGTAVTTTVSSASPVPASQASAFTVYMILAPGTYGGTVTVTTDRAEYRFPLKASQTFRRSVIRILGVDLGTCTDITASGDKGPIFYELPAFTVTATSSGPETFGDTSWYEYDLDTPTRKVVMHTFSDGGRLYRNFTSCVDQTLRCPLWVAYVMHNVPYPNNGVSRGSFSNQTSYDPAIPAEWQSNGTTFDYNNGEGYARGHLCASADRRNTEDANQQTFYYTNQAPQRHNYFNNGVWKYLESAVQNYTAGLNGSDTLYVVSGTLFEDNNFAASNDWGDVARPSHFYKLLMKCRFESSGRMTAAQGAAYLYENKHYYDVYFYDAAFRTTIDAIEERAGFDFFAAVRADLQTIAESTFSDILQ